MITTKKIVSVKRHVQILFLILLAKIKRTHDKLRP